jgi:hypothetical protein
MLRRPRALLFGVACALSCSLPPMARGGGPHKPPPVSPGPPPATALPLTERATLEPDIAELPAEPPPPLIGATGAIRYRLLRAVDCQCLAVIHSSVGNLLARERAGLANGHRCGEKSSLSFLFPRQCDQSVTELKTAILAYSEQESRNRSAGDALDLYYRLAESEAKSDLLDHAAADLADAVQRSRDFLQQGFKLPVELTTLQRQEIDARADRIKLAAAIVELNGRLKGMIGQQDLPPEEHLWPAGEFDVVFNPLDVDAAVQIALRRRAELNLLRTLILDLDAKTLPVIRDFLTGLNALLGEQAKHSTPPGRMYDVTKNLLTGQASERSVRKGQLQQLLTDRERAVAAEVRQAAAESHAKAQLLVLGRERVATANTRQRDAEEKAQSGGGSFLEVLNAKLEAYKARAQLVEDLMGWHAARARLRQAQGLLVLECCTP